MRLARVLLFLVSAAALVNLAFAIGRRLVYPYDLEWMEGGMLCHALRVVQREPIYAEPSARFVSFAYTPLYPILLGLLAPVAGVGYVPARAVSVADRKSTRLNSSHVAISYAVFCLKKKNGRD